MKSENAVSKECIEYLKKIGAYTIRNANATKSGVPDLTVCYKGLFIGIEFKREGLDRMREVQKRNAVAIIKAGGTFLKINDIEELKDFIEKIKE